MDANIQSVAIFLVIMLAHLCWMGLLVGAISGSTKRLIRLTRPDHQYRLSLACLSLLWLCLPAAWVLTGASFSMVDEPVVATGAVQNALASFERASWGDDQQQSDVRGSQPTSLGGPGTRPTESTPLEIIPIPSVNQNHETVELPVGAEWGDGQSVEMKTERFEEQRSGTGLAKSTWALGVAAVYLVGCFAMFIRLIMSWVGCRRLVRYSSLIEETALLQLAETVSRRLGLTVVPLLSVCERIATPFVVGCVRPMILLPPSMLTGMPIEQLEAILVHEMAHLRRYDHWVVLSQRCLETVMFFHPVTWWISRDLDRQRELCCDDLVVEFGVEPLDYAESLLFVAQRHQHTNAAEHSMAIGAIGATGVRRSELVDRIRRVLGAPAMPSTLPARWPSALAGIGLLSVVPAVLAMFAVLNLPDHRPGLNSATGTPGASDKNAVRNSTTRSAVAPSPPSGLPSKTSPFPRKSGKTLGGEGWGEGVLIADVTIVIDVVDSEGNPVPDAIVNYWCDSFRIGRPRGEDFVNEWVSQGQVTADMTGRTSLPILDSSFTNVQITAFDSTAGKRVGSVSVYLPNLNQELPMRLTLNAGKTFSGSLLDYDSSEPIAQARLMLFTKAKGRVGWINTGRTLHSDENGQFAIGGLEPERDYAIKVSHPKYHPIGEYALMFSPRYPGGNKSVKLLSNAAYDRVMESARLSLPDTIGLSASKAFDVLAKRFDADVQLKKKLKPEQQFVRRDAVGEFLVGMRMLPLDLYRAAMWELAGTEGACEGQYRALSWLTEPKHGDNREELMRQRRLTVADSKDKKYIRYRRESRKIAEAFVDRFVDNGLVGVEDNEFIRSFHAHPQVALTTVLEHHPARNVQAAAAVQLGYLLSEYHPWRERLHAVNVASRQAEERAVWELVIRKYDDVGLNEAERSRADDSLGNFAPSNIEFPGEPFPTNYDDMEIRVEDSQGAKHHWAGISPGKIARKKIEFLDKFGVGGVAPELSGESMSGGTIRLGDYGGKLTVLHFCRNQGLEIYEDLHFLKEQYPDSLRLFGVTVGYGNDKQESQPLLDRCEVDWPVLWDSRHSSGFALSGGEQFHFGIQALMWGGEEMFSLRNFETFVIDPTGKILAVGLEGAELREFVARQLSEKSDNVD